MCPEHLSWTNNGWVKWSCSFHSISASKRCEEFCLIIHEMWRQLSTLSYYLVVNLRNGLMLIGKCRDYLGTIVKACLREHVVPVTGSYKFRSWAYVVSIHILQPVFKSQVWLVHINPFLIRSVSWQLRLVLIYYILLGLFLHLSFKLAGVCRYI